MLSDNPEFVRLVRSKLRPRTMVSRAAFMVLLLGGILALAYWVALESGTNLSRVYRYYFVGVVSILALMITLLGLTQAAQSIALERERHTLDFQRLVSMGPWRLAFGKLYGCSIEVWWLVVCALPFLIFPGVMGAVPWWAFIHAFVLLAAFGTFVNSVGLISSAIAEKMSKAASNALVIGGACYLFTVIARIGTPGGINLWKSWAPYYHLVGVNDAIVTGVGMPVFSLFGIDIPLLVGCVLVNGFFSFLLFCASVRRLSDPELSLLSVEQAFGAFLLLQFLIVGGGWESLDMEPVLFMTTFHGMNAVALCAAPFLLMPSNDLLRSRAHRAVLNEHWKILLEPRNRLQDSPPVSAQLLLTAVYVVLSFVVTWYAVGKTDTVLSQTEAWQMKSACLPLTVMVAGLGMACCSMLLYLQVTMAKGGLKFGLALIVVLQIVPPVAVMLLTKPENSVFVSPMAYLIVSGYLGETGNTYDLLETSEGAWAVPAICATAAVLGGALAAMRFRYLLDVAGIEKRKALDEQSQPGADGPRTTDEARRVVRRLQETAQQVFAESPAEETKPSGKEES